MNLENSNEIKFMKIKCDLSHINEIIEEKYRVTHRPHSAERELHRGSTCKPTNCETEDFPINSRVTSSSSASSRLRNKGRCRDPSSTHESCHPPSLSTAIEAYRRGLPGKKIVVCLNFVVQCKTFSNISCCFDNE